MIRNLPQQWDMETDLVAIGSGIGGLSAAIAAHDEGASAMVLERADKVGGVTALSLGELWVAGNHLAAALGLEDSVDAGFRYLRRLSMGYGDEALILNKVVHAREALRYFERTIGLKMRVVRDAPDYYYKHSDDAVAEGRLLEVEPFPAQQLGDWQEKTRVSPVVPFGMTHEDMYGRGGTANIARWDFELMGERLGNDIRCLGPGLVAYFVKAALERDIPLHTGVNVEELIGDGERIIGVRATRDGKDLFIKANRGVVVAVSSYERHQELNKTLGQQLEPISYVFDTIDGANFRLAGPFGARVARVPDITLLGYNIPGEETEEGHPLPRGAMTSIGLPHVIVVNGAGKRFGNEAFYRQFNYTVDQIDGASQTHPNFPCWAILDTQAKDKYPFGSIMPDQAWPTGFGLQADSIAELAGKMGVDAQSLEATIGGFNRHAEQGEDPAFGRGTHPWSAWMCGDPFHKPNANLGPLNKPPFYAVELKRMGGSAIPAAGLLADEHCRALGWDNQPIPGLYVAGNSMARMETGAVMQSGISNARGMMHGYLIGHHVAGKPSELLQQAIARLAP
ncbi:FAD-binding protein [Mangrovimicrobium sediminis]|uniref:FAD-binding protein n=1 Tax=Mangrovimicrobium sediminis TaxID=2562682 RepID=A0A4Z0LYR7_9GAMM|nr:FAD-binding protein [Haliea sp. SAOS-164]TGD72316.1 FAD-binding protein [Haliea sp. SAOS-164]